ncbi:hypothetical protein OQA88_5809 [Cercophora sp. LCS_1]
MGHRSREDVELVDVGREPATSPVDPTLMQRRAHAADDSKDQDMGHVEIVPNNDRKELVRLISAGYSFFVAGVNDGSLGSLIPYVVRLYGINTAIVSSLYAAAFSGWLLAAFSNAHLSQRLDLGAMLMLGAFLQTLANILRAWPTPPFVLYVFTFLFASLGQAYQDTHANTFVASRGGHAHRWLGFIHAMYMAGVFVAPFASASIAASSKSSPWYLFYTVPLALGVLNMALVLVAFRDSIKMISKPAQGSEEAGAGKSATTLVKDALSRRSVWQLSLFFFFYLGAVLTAGGWVVEYLVTVRNGDIDKMGYVSAGFGGGSLLGRILLPEPTHRFGERKMVFLYCVLCLGFQLVFWLVPNIIAASVAISLFGFFSAPLFATGLSVGTRILPPSISATAISFVFVFAQTGGSLFPIVTGLLGSYVGVGVLQPMLVALISATGISWLFVPQPKAEANVA